MNEEIQTLAFQKLTVTTGARNLKQKSKYTNIMAKTAETQGPISLTSIHVIVPGSRAGRGTGSRGRTNCDEVVDYVVPIVLSPRDLVSRPDNMDEKLYYHHVIVPHRMKTCFSIFRTSNNQAQNSAYASAQS